METGMADKASVVTDVLTEKQETFAVVFVQTANATEAYRQAYDVAPDARDSWIYVEAAQLLDHPKIAPRIQELRNKAKKRSEYNVFSAMDELEAARKLAQKEKQAGAAVSAVNGKIKLLGLDKPSKHEVTGKDGGPIQTEEVTHDADAFARAMAGLAARASRGGVGEDDPGGEGSP